jgi:hypothetical protein
MKGLDNPNYLVAYIISNIAGLIILWAAIKRPYLARLMFVILFSWACVANYTLAHQKPEEYLNYADTSIKWYRDFIHGWFTNHITIMVSSIAIGEGLIAIGMILKGWWVKLSCIGVIVFLMAIAPLGVYAGFPFSITVSIAAFVVLKKNAVNYLWQYDVLQKTSHVKFPYDIHQK